MQAKNRAVYLDKELHSASYVGEIIVKNYETYRDSTGHECIRKMQYAQIANPDSIHSAFPATSISFPVSYTLNSATKGREIDEGYWPDPGDTVLLVMDSTQHISLFAAIVKDNYEFWSPYFTNAWVTVFYFNDPAKPVPVKKMKSMQKSIQSHAKEEGYTYACLYHCRLPKKSLVACI